MFRERALAVGRAVLEVVAFFAAYVAVALAVGWLHGFVPTGNWWRGAARGLLGLSLPPLVAAGVVYAGLVAVCRRAPGTWGVPRWQAGIRGLGRGMAWGVGLAAATVLMCVGGGAQLLVRPTPGETYGSVAAPLAVGLAVAALLEELLFRGFPLARLAESTGPAVAAVVLAAAFAAAHAPNPDVSGVGLVNIGLAALLLSAAFFSPGGLATAFGLHLGWNAALALGADAPVSGLRFGLPTLEFAPGPRSWWTGGGFGPEGGLAATLVLGGALVWWVRARAHGPVLGVREGET